MERPRVEELAPADLGAVDVGREEDHAAIQLCPISSGSWYQVWRSPTRARSFQRVDFGRLVDRVAEGRDLGSRVEQDRPAVVEVEVLRRELDGEVLVERVEVAGDRPPPAPVVRGERQDARHVDRAQAVAGVRGRRRPAPSGCSASRTSASRTSLRLIFTIWSFDSRSSASGRVGLDSGEPVGELEAVAHLEAVDQDVDRAAPRHVDEVGLLAAEQGVVPLVRRVALARRGARRRRRDPCPGSRSRGPPRPAGCAPASRARGPGRPSRPSAGPAGPAFVARSTTRRASASGSCSVRARRVARVTGHRPSS